MASKNLIPGVVWSATSSHSWGSFQELRTDGCFLFYFVSFFLFGDDSQVLYMGNLFGNLFVSLMLFSQLNQNLNSEVLSQDLSKEKVFKL